MPDEIMVDAAAPAAAPESAAAVPPTAAQDADTAGIQPASPEEQGQYDHFVTKAMELIYDDAMLPKIVDMLDGGADGADGGDPVKGLAMAADMIVARIGAAAEQAGEKLSPDVVFHAGGEILEDLANLSMESGIRDFSSDPDALEAAWFQALDLFRDRLSQAGELDQGAAAADLDRLIKMDQNGTLEKVMRDLAANDEAGQAGEREPPASSKKPARKGFAMEAA